jgi:hypothetical protein
MRNAYENLDRKSEKGEHMGDLSADGKILFDKFKKREIFAKV